MTNKGSKHSSKNQTHKTIKDKNSKFKDGEVTQHLLERKPNADEKTHENYESNNDMTQPLLQNSKTASNKQAQSPMEKRRHQRKKRSVWLKGSHLRVLLLIVFLMGYVLTGTSIFLFLESSMDAEARKSLRTLRNDFLDNHACLGDAELEAFIVEIIEANNRGVSAIANVTMEPNWSFGQSLFFASTILTTIGYGHVTPLSEGGKIFCIVYASIGIPLTLIMFTALVERLMIPTTMLLQFLIRRLGHAYRTIHIRLIHVSILLVLLLVFIFLIPATIFMVIEDNWNFLDAFYYCYISMTTIGLGDYIPGDNVQQKNRPIYKICTTFYLFCGLICMMLTLANIYDVPELNIGYHFYMKSDEEDEEEVGRSAERTPIRSEAGGQPPKYSQQVNEGYQAATDGGHSPKVEEKAGLTQ